MKRLVLVLAASIAWTLPALADGCYICRTGSGCGQYCKYSGSDNGDNRKKCRAAGCEIGGTASCPTGVNIKTCRAGAPLDRLYALATGPFADECAQ